MAGDNQQFCLRWNNHQSTLISVFDSLLESGTLVDCTLAAEGQYLKAHKVVLSACSPYLELLLSQHYEKHPIVILKDVKFQELKSMMDYMYRGEVNITQDQLATFLKAAESLQIKGLSESSGSTDDARDVGSTAKRPREEPPPRRPVPPHPQARLPHSSGLTIEPRRSIPHSSEMAPASPMKSREGSTSPVARKRRRRRPSGGDDASNAALSDSQLDTSNSCDLPPVSNQAQSTPISVPSILATPSASNNQSESDQPLETEALSRFPNTTGSELMVKTKMEPNTDQLIEPKTEYLEDINNEDSVEDLTLDDDDEMPGPSHADGSNQNFSQWQMAGDRSTDEVFMAAQEAVGAHRDSQDKALSPKVLFSDLVSFLKHRSYAVEHISTPIQTRGSVNLVVDYMISKYGIYPKKEDKLLVAKQAVALHPELRVATAAVDCERLFDPHTRSGPLEWRLKTIRSARARELKEQAVTLTAAPSPTSSTDDMMEGKDLYEAKNQILLSNTVEDKSVIVEASRDTAVQRHDYIAHNPTADLQALFPRYFDFVPHLVCVDFDVLYPNAKSLSKWWEPRSKIVRYLFKRTAEKSLKNFASQHLLDWNTEAQNILKLLLLAKPPKLGLAEGPLAVFGEFLRFKDESIPFDRWSDEVIEREKNQKAPPLIVAEGVSKSKINRYLVLVDGIKLPQVSDIITALDLYFKSFFVFNIGYPETVKQFLKFLQVYVYEILRSDLRHCTLKTKCLANDIELAFGDLEKEPSQDPLIIE